MTVRNFSPLSLDRVANNSHFFLRVRTIPDDSFTVTAFKGLDHGISRDFRFTLSVITDSEISPDTVIGNSATIELSWGSTPIYLHGIVSEFSRDNNTPTEMSYLAVVTSPVNPLTKNLNNRVFLNKTTPQIIKEILLSAGYAREEFTMELSGSYFAHEFIVQYCETDFDFLLRMIAHVGIFFTFVSDETHTVILFCDQSTDRPLVPGVDELLYEPQTGTARTIETAYRISPVAHLQPGRVRVTDYNYRTPEIRLESIQDSAAVNTYGEHSVYGDHFKDLEQGEKIAKIRQQALDVQRQCYIAETDCRGIIPGFILNITNHSSEDLNGEYLVVNMTHTADQGAGMSLGRDSKGPTYSNLLELIKADVPYRSMIPKQTQLLGTFTSRIESKDAEYAYLDDQGRYRIRLDFDRGPADTAEASHPVRMLQPYGGSNYGMHFPLHGGTEVAVCCANGDLNRPIILGALNNPATPSVVNANNRTQNIIRTASGNELCMDDRIQQEKIDLFTADKKNILTLDATAEAHKIRLATEEGKMEILAKKTILIESGDSQNVQVGKDHLITVENRQQLLTRNKEIELQAATDIRFKAAKNIQFDAEKEDIRMTSARDLLVDVGQNLSIEVRKENMAVNVVNGQFSLKAAQDISILGKGGGPIVISQKSGNITMSTSGNLTMKGPGVSIYGKSINLKGNRIGGN